MPLPKEKATICFSRSHEKIRCSRAADLFFGFLLYFCNQFAGFHFQYLSDTPNRFEIWLLASGFDHTQMAAGYGSKTAEYFLGETFLNTVLSNDPSNSFVIKLHTLTTLPLYRILDYEEINVYEDRQTVKAVIQFLKGGSAMNQDERLRMDALDAIAKQDPQYQKMMRQMRKIEEAYNTVLRGLNDMERDAVCEFVAQCEEISWYMLELACRNMRFQ